MNICSEDPYEGSSHTLTSFQTNSTGSYREFVEDYRYGYYNYFWVDRYDIVVQNRSV